MKEVILCYQGEMALKGLNKATFEAALAKALRFRVRELGKLAAASSSRGSTYMVLWAL